MCKIIDESEARPDVGCTELLGAYQPPRVRLLDKRLGVILRSLCNGKFQVKTFDGDLAEVFPEDVDPC